MFNKKITTAILLLLLCLASGLQAAENDYDDIGFHRATSSAAWTARKGHQALVFNDKLWVIGGEDGSKRRDIWSSTDGWNWVKEYYDTEEMFVAREAHQTVKFNNKIWVIGGNPEFNDVWSSTDGIKWEQETSSAAWSERDSHQSVVFDESMWVLGGNNGEHLNDVWSSTDGVKWSSASVNGNSTWSARFGHQAVVFDDKIWVMGGYDGGYLNDVWHSKDGKIWHEITSSAPWTRREGHRAVVYDNKIWLFGGNIKEAQTYSSEVWYSEDGIEWTEASDGIFPSRAYHQAAVFRDEIWILGGETEEEELKNDVWLSMYPPKALSFSGRALSTTEIEWEWNKPLAWTDDEPNITDSGYTLDIEGVDIPDDKRFWDHESWLIEGLEPNSEYKAYFHIRYSTGTEEHTLEPVTAIVSTLAIPIEEPDYFVDPGLKPTVGATKIILRWKAVEGVSHYRLKRGTETLKEEYEHSAGGDIVSYLDEDLEPETKYEYEIFPLNRDGEYDEGEALIISVTTTGSGVYEAERKFITPSSRSVSFGENAEEVLIVDIRGRTVAELDEKDPFIEWRPDEEVRGQLESGIYVYQVKTGDGEINHGTIVIAK